MFIKISNFLYVFVRIVRHYDIYVYIYILNRYFKIEHFIFYQIS